MGLFRKPLTVNLEDAGAFSAGKSCLVCADRGGVAPVLRQFTHTRVIDRTSGLVKTLNVLGALLMVVGIGGMMARNLTYQTTEARLAVPLCGKCREKLKNEESGGGKLSKIGDYLIAGVLGGFATLIVGFVLMFLVPQGGIAMTIIYYVLQAAFAGLMLIIIVTLLLVATAKSRTLIKVRDITGDRIVFDVKRRVLADAASLNLPRSNL